MKYDFVKGLFVGFLLNWDIVEMIKGGGIKFEDWEWYEFLFVMILDNCDSGIDFKKVFEEYKVVLGKKF